MRLICILFSIFLPQFQICIMFIWKQGVRQVVKIEKKKCCNSAFNSDLCLFLHHHRNGPVTTEKKQGCACWAESNASDTIWVKWGHLSFWDSAPHLAKACLSALPSCLFSNIVFFFFLLLCWKFTGRQRDHVLWHGVLTGTVRLGDFPVQDLKGLAAQVIKTYLDSFYVSAEFRRQR